MRAKTAENLSKRAKKLIYMCPVFRPNIVQNMKGLCVRQNSTWSVDLDWGRMADGKIFCCVGSLNMLVPRKTNKKDSFEGFA